MLDGHGGRKTVKWYHSIDKLSTLPYRYVDATYADSSNCLLTSGIPETKIK